MSNSNNMSVKEICYYASEGKLTAAGFKMSPSLSFFSTQLANCIRDFSSTSPQASDRGHF